LDWNVLFAFGLTLVAGLATGIGSALAFFTHRTSTRFLSVALGFSAGVMIYVSMVEIFFKAKSALVDALGSPLGAWVTVASFFGGIGFHRTDRQGYSRKYQTRTNRTASRGG